MTNVLNQQLPLYIGRKLRALRIAKSMTLEQLAEKADLHHTYIGTIERGKSKASVQTLIQLAIGLELKCPSKLIAPFTQEVYTSLLKQE